MYVNYNSGHQRSSIAIENSLKTLAPDIQILNINGFNYTNPILERIINKTYMAVIKRQPQVWDYLYDNPKVFKKAQALRDFLHNMNCEKLQGLFMDFKPDAVACTQALPCGMVADLKSRNPSIKTKLFGVLTDHAPHMYWIYPTVDYFIVPSQKAQERFIEQGVEREKIKVFGIPIDPKFNNKVDKKIVRMQLGIDEKKPVVLVMGGGHGYGPIKDIVLNLDEAGGNFQLIVITGINARLFKWLERERPQFKKTIIPLEFVENVNELMDIADIIITKPGGLTTAEALAKGLPMIVTSPIPGQEAKNAQFLTSAGAAEEVDDVALVGNKTAELLSNPLKLKSMREAALKHGHPDSATKLAKLIYDSIHPL